MEGKEIKEERVHPPEACTGMFSVFPLSEAAVDDCPIICLCVQFENRIGQSAAILTSRVGPLMPRLTAVLLET